MAVPTCENGLTGRTAGVASLYAELPCRVYRRGAKCIHAIKARAITVHIHAHARTSSSPRNPNRRYSNYYGVSAFPWRSARTFGHAKLPVCSRNVVTRADVHFHYRLIELIFSARAESACSCAVFPWRFTNVREYDDPRCKHKYLTWEWNQRHAICISCIVVRT